MGVALASSGVARDDIFLTTKVWYERIAPGDLQRSVDESLTSCAPIMSICC